MEKLDDYPVTAYPKKWLPTGNHSLEKKGILIDLWPIQKIIECALISPYLKGEKPFSLLIVAKPESGKTTVMKQYRENKGVLYLTDCTAFGITRDFLPKIATGEIKTIMIPDLTTPLSKQTKTRAGLVAFLNNLIEEGVAKMSTGAVAYSRDVDAVANLITSVTDQSFGDARHGWNKLGFLSRCVVITYSYSWSSVNAIMNEYSEHGIDEKGLEKRCKVKLPRRSVDINLPKEIADRLDPYARDIGRVYDLYGFRAKINFRSLLKCLAYRNGRRVVTDADFEEFLELVDFMNFDFRPI